MPLGRKVGLDSADIVLDGDPTAVPKKTVQSLTPQISAHVYCVKTAGWTKTPLGTEVGLDPRDIVFDGDPALLSPKGGQSPTIVGPLSIVAKRLHGTRCHLVWW